jgi:hypothetical protein
LVGDKNSVTAPERFEVKKEGPNMLATPALHSIHGNLPAIGELAVRLGLHRYI